MQYIYTFVFLLLAISGYGQGYFILNDGTKVPFESYKSKGDNLVVKNFKTKKEILEKTIAGRYSDDSVFYHRFTVPNPGVKPDPRYEYYPDWKDSVSVYHNRILPGRVSIYIDYVSSGYAGPGTASYTKTVLYAKKGNWFGQIFFSNLIQNKQEGREKMTLLLGDQPEIVAKMDEDFRMTENYIKNLVRDYNLLQYEEPKIDKQTAYNEVVLYRRDKNQAAVAIEYNMKDTTFTLKVNSYARYKIPAGVPFKICPGEGKKFCELIEASPYFTNYYEVSLTTAGEYSLELKEKKEYEGDLRKMNYPLKKAGK